MPCILVGSSHGGYVANMCAKIAPWCVEAVIDNSSWNLPVLIYDEKKYDITTFKMLGFGKDLDFRKYYRSMHQTENFNIFVADYTKWRFDDITPNYFSRSRYEIRDVSLGLETQSSIKKAIYVGYHSVFDKIAPISFKLDFYSKLKNLGFDSTLHVIDEQSKVDGKFIKDLDHGMSMSLKTLILKEVPSILAKLEGQGKFSGVESKTKREISYKTDEWIYDFKEMENRLILECKKI